MPSKRKSHRIRRTLGVAVSLVILVVPAIPAGAHNGQPPFELYFPQPVISTQFDSTFGSPRSGGRRHEGNDLMAPKMTEVYAAAAGFVDTITVSSNAGRYVTINHADGWSTAYMHLNNDNPGTDDGAADWALTVASGLEVGSFVFAGQLIGYVGDSGNAEWTGSHTHFELRHDGVAVNPYRLLRDAEERARAELPDHLWRLAAPLDLDLMR